MTPSCKHNNGYYPKIIPGIHAIPLCCNDCDETIRVID
jgi:hypothetical protein